MKSAIFLELLLSHSQTKLPEIFYKEMSLSKSSP